MLGRGCVNVALTYSEGFLHLEDSVVGVPEGYEYTVLTW